MHSRHLTLLERPGSSSEDSLQKLLLRLSEAAAQGVNADGLVQFFCAATREFLQVDGAYFWELGPDGELIGGHADGFMAAGFPGRQLKPEHSAVAADAIRTRKAAYINRPDPRRYRIAAEFHAKSLMAAPLIVCNQAVGAAVFINVSDPAFFNDDMAGKATILIGQLGILLESARSNQTATPEHDRAKILAELAQQIQGENSRENLAQSIADRMRKSLGTPLLAVLIRHGDSLKLEALADESAGASASIRARYERKALPFARDLAERALAANEPITVSIDTTAHGLNETVPAGSLLAVPIRSPHIEGAILAYPRRTLPFTRDEKSLVSAVAAVSALGFADSGPAATPHTAHTVSSPWPEIFDAIGDFIVAHDPADRVLRVNRALANFVGVEPDELVGVDMGALLAVAEEKTPRSCPFCPTVTEKNVEEYQHPLLERTFLVSSSRPESVVEGSQIIHVLRDITDRREAERRYHELFDNIQEGVFFFTPEGRFVEVNDALVRMLGYHHRGDLLRADIRTQVFPSAEQYDQFCSRMVQHGPMRNLELTLRRQDASPVQVLISAFAARDAQERIVQYRGVILDITGLKSSQSDLQRERDFSDQILSNTQSLVLVADRSGNITYANRRWSELGYERESVIGRPLEQLIAPVSRRDFLEACSATLAGRQVSNLELQILRGEGRLGCFSVNLSPMRDEQDNVTSVVVVMSDITDVATLQAKLIHAEKMSAVGQLVSGVAHEVNNPLTAILGFADLLMENTEIPDSARKDLRVILQEAQRTKQIVQNLLSVARQTPPQRAPIQLNTILRRTIQLRSYDFHSRGVEVVEQLDPVLPQIVGDAHQLQQVFLNILNNAYDAIRDTGRPARIEVTSSRLGNKIEVAFRDNGHGILNQERIFDPFFTTKEVGKGTGLGLSICWGIVREHGGEIFGHNNSGGPGATFVVRLPISPATISTEVTSGVPS